MIAFLHRLRARFSRDATIRALQKTNDQLVDALASALTQNQLQKTSLQLLNQALTNTVHERDAAREALERHVGGRGKSVPVSH